MECCIHTTFTPKEKGDERLSFPQRFCNVVYSPLLYTQHPRYSATMRNTLQTKVGLRIKDLRAVHDVSQERFANKIGMDRTYLASIEVGQRNVTLQNLAKIANGFDMTLSEFFEGIPRIDPSA
ncbi:helix-turn-helix domain-containing protein [Eggerthella sinensis]|uniref:helix-turn-helix domain-containing protein n=1 Tax=Eggerthella sinensis TaxID=242230 RepID=UPI0031E8D17D